MDITGSRITCLHWLYAGGPEGKQTAQGPRAGLDATCDGTEPVDDAEMARPVLPSPAWNASWLPHRGVAGSWLKRHDSRMSPTGAMTAGRDVTFRTPSGAPGALPATAKTVLGFSN